MRLNELDMLLGVSLKCKEGSPFNIYIWSHMSQARKLVSFAPGGSRKERRGRSRGVAGSFGSPRTS